MPPRITPKTETDVAEINELREWAESLSDDLFIRFAKAVVILGIEPIDDKTVRMVELALKHGMAKKFHKVMYSDDKAYTEVSKEEKVKYVKSRGQTQKHHCHWPGCDKPCPPAKWGCYKCWIKLPKYIRDRIWKAYRPGQEESKTPSKEYVLAAREAQNWIAKNYGTT